MTVEGETSDFCSELRSKTRNVHDESDRLINLKLVVALTDTKLYGEAVSQFYFVYRTIEECIYRHREDPRMRGFYINEMFRRQAFERDLEFYFGPDWNEKIKPSTPAQAYCDRVFEIADKNPTLLIAYIHTMYLALLAGGQILKRIIKRTLGLSGGLGLNLFQFDDIDRVELRKLIKANINSLELSQQEKDAVIQEEIKVFQMNNLLAKTIQPSWKNYKRLAAISISLVAVILFGFYSLFRFFKQ